MGKDILRNIGSIYRATNSFTDYIVKQLHLEKGQYQFLVRIQENQDINQEELSSLLQVDKATTAKAIRKLVEKEYVVKTKSLEDKRSFKLRLTNLGKDVCDFLNKEENFCIQFALEGLTQKEQNELNILLGKMKDNIGSIWSDIRKGRQDYYVNKIKNEY